MIRLYIFCLTLFLVKKVYAQQAEDNQPAFEISIHGLLSKSYIVDTKFSNIPYNGIIGGLGIGLKYSKNKVCHEVAASFTNGDIEPASVSDMDLRSRYINAKYIFLHDIYKGVTGRFRLQAGASIDWLGAKRKYSGFINNTNSSESISSLGAVAELGFKFEKFLGGIVLSDRFNFPVFSYVVQPWLITADQKDHRKKRFAGPGPYLRLENAIEIQKNISRHHAFSISYVFGHYRIDGFYTVKNLAHSADFSYTYIF